MEAIVLSMLPKCQQARRLAGQQNDKGESLLTGARHKKAAPGWSPGAAWPRERINLARAILPWPWPITKRSDKP